MATDSDRALARLRALLTSEWKPVGMDEIDVAREVLAQLSQRSEDGRLRDAIGEVRHALADWQDELEVPS
jgi:hypothetical protein